MVDLAQYKYDGSGKFKLSRVKTDDTGKFNSKEEASKHMQLILKI